MSKTCFTAVRFSAEHINTASWPPFEAAIQGLFVRAFVDLALDGRVKPCHDGEGRRGQRLPSQVGAKLEKKCFGAETSTGQA